MYLIFVSSLEHVYRLMKSVFFTQLHDFPCFQAWKRAQETWQKARGACGEGRVLGFIKQVYDMGVSKNNIKSPNHPFQ